MDIRDWGKFIRGRWDWTAGGYEAGFPRGCAFTDIDAATEFDGHSLDIEPKHYDGVGPVPPGPPTGQRLFLMDEVSRGKTVLVVYGCGACNDPWVVVRYVEGIRAESHDWREGFDKPERRRRFKCLIDQAMGLTDEGLADEAAS